MLIGSVLSAWNWRFAAISFGTLVVTYLVRESMKEHHKKDRLATAIANRQHNKISYLYFSMKGRLKQ